MISPMVTAGILCLLVCAGAVYASVRYKNRIEREMSRILESLDRALAGEIQEVTFDESLNGAITERLNRLLEAAKSGRGRAEEERNAVKALISDISHQVRTPLANIMLYAGLLKERENGEEALAGRILSQAEKLDFFMKELVRSSYLETEMIKVHPKKNLAAELVRRACQNLEVQAMKKEISFEIGENQCQAYFDMDWSVEALGNLLDNAVKYAPIRSTVWLRMKEQESFLCIQVEDEGQGIPEEEQAMIFKRFYRSPKARKEKGLGIGLYLAREIVEKQGGYIKVTSGEGKGAVFEMFLSKLPVSGRDYIEISKLK